MSISLSEQVNKLQKQAQRWLSQARSRIDQDINFGILGLFIPQGDITDGFLGDKPTGFSTTLYSLFPFLFYELFPQVPLESYRNLSLSISLYLDYMVMMDRLMDGKAILEPNIVFWLTSIQQKAITLLASLFPPDSPLWPYFDRCRRENTHALVLERVKHTFRVSPYSEEETILIAAGKSSMAKAGIAALAFLAREEQLPSDLISSCEAWHVGLQLFDDLRDWRTDYLAHMYSPLLTQVILDNKLAEKVEAENRLDVNVIGSLIYSGDYAQAAIAQARDFFKLAMYYARGMSCSGWQAAITEMLQQCQGTSEAIREKMKNIHQKQQVSASKPSRHTCPASEPNWQIHPIYESLEAELASTTTNRIQTYLESQRVILSDFWCASKTSSEAAQARMSECAAQLAQWPSTADISKASQSILMRCHELASLPQQLHVHLLVGGTTTDARGFLKDGMVHLGIALDDWIYRQLTPDIPVQFNTLADLVRVRVAREYGRVLRMLEFPHSENLLDAICAEGVALAFAHGACPDIPLHKLLNLSPDALVWFQSNKNYLWQEIQGFLVSTAQRITSFYLDEKPSILKGVRDHYNLRIGSLLGYDMVSNYHQRIGKQSWNDLAQMPALAILRKGLTMEFAAMVSGGHYVRLDQPNVDF